MIVLLWESFSVRNTFDQCRTFHREWRHEPQISTFPKILSPPPLSSVEVLDNIQLSVDSLSSRYGKVAQRNINVCDKVFCQQIISDAETLLSDKLILNLSSVLWKYLTDKLRRTIMRVRTIYQTSKKWLLMILLYLLTGVKSWILHYPSTPTTKQPRPSWLKKLSVIDPSSE